MVVNDRRSKGEQMTTAKQFDLIWQFDLDGNEVYVPCYARDFLEKHREEIRATLLRTEKLEDALRFYAVKENYMPTKERGSLKSGKGRAVIFHSRPKIQDDDFGQRAREALNQQEE